MDDFEPEAEALDVAAAKAHEVRTTHANTVAFLLAELGDAATDTDAPQAASFALATIQRHALNACGHRLTPTERDAILLAMMKARLTIVSCVADRWTGAKQEANARAMVCDAFEATCALITIWAEPDPARRRPRDFIAELRERARWLRNELHNIALETQLRRRRAPRVLRAVETLKANALQVRHG